jgi:hypothetical protein
LLGLLALAAGSWDVRVSVWRAEVLSSAKGAEMDTLLIPDVTDRKQADRTRIHRCRYDAT